MPITASVLADVLIFSINKKVRFKCQIEFEILSILDNRDYALIIGRPDIVKYNLLGRFASQWQADLVSDTNHGAEKGHASMPNSIEYNLLNKFASRWHSGTDLETGGGTEKNHGHVTAHSEATLHSVATVSETMTPGDMPQTSTLTSHTYDEDEEVIQYEHWEDAWQKNDCSGSQIDDVLDVIVNNVRSSNVEFKIRTRSFLAEWRDIFSRTLSKEPANLAPLEIEVDAEKWQTRQSQGPPRIM